MKLILFRLTELAEQFFVHHLHQTRKSINNELSNFGLIEEIMDPSRSFLTIGRGKWVTFLKLYNSIFYDHHP